MHVQRLLVEPISRRKIPSIVGERRQRGEAIAVQRMILAPRIADNRQCFAQQRLRLTVCVGVFRGNAAYMEQALRDLPVVLPPQFTSLTESFLSGLDRVQVSSRGVKLFRAALGLVRSLPAGTVIGGSIQELLDVVGPRTRFASLPMICLWMGQADLIVSPDRLFGVSQRLFDLPEQQQGARQGQRMRARSLTLLVDLRRELDSQ